MPGVRNLTAGSPSATATGLTGLDATTAVSTAFWWRPPATVALNSDIFNHGVIGAGLQGWEVYTAGSVPTAMFVRIGDASAADGIGSGGGYVLPGVWAHYAITYDQARVRFYRNGVFFSSTANTRAMTTGGTRGTQIGSAVQGPFQGSLFDLQHFPATVLSAPGVRDTMDPRQSVTGCNGRWFRWWKNGGSVTIRDESGNGNDLTASATLARCAQCDEPNWVRATRPRGASSRTRPLYLANGAVVTVDLNVTGAAFSFAGGTFDLLQLTSEGGDDRADRVRRRTIGVF